MGWQKVWEEIYKEDGKKLAKIEVSFFRRETLKGGRGNIRVEDSGLDLFYLLFSFFIFISFIFLFWDLGLEVSITLHITVIIASFSYITILYDSV